MANFSDAPAQAPTIQRANPGSAYQIAGLIAHAFWELPPAAWLVPEPLARQRAMAGQFQIIVEHAMEYGHVDVVTDASGVVGAAVWLYRPTPIQSAPQNYVPRLEAACGRWTDNFLVLDDVFEQHHPSEPHHHLAFLAVDPLRQRQGIGTILLQSYHHRLDTMGLGAYLEAPNEANVEFYRRHGYQAREPFYLPCGGPPFWPMWREAHSVKQNSA